MSLRWGLGAGAISAVLGLLALIIGAVVEPIHLVSTAYAVVLALFVRGLLALLALAMAMTLAYYAGWQVEARLTLGAEDAATGSGATQPPTPVAAKPTGRISDTRIQATLTGALVLALYWLATTLYIVTLGSRFGGVGSQGVAPLTFTLSHLVQGIVFVGLGAGAAGLGGRAAAAHQLLQRLTTLAVAGGPSASSATSASAPTGAPTMQGAQPTGAEAAPLPADTPPDDDAPTER
ncbi:MAG TPA: hypothetical protein VMV29_07885 [Ktedonobacterales bacterium]|nr:hypothetical protein [Ktedonobacterales bacterium]